MRFHVVIFLLVLGLVSGLPAGGETCEESAENGIEGHTFNDLTITSTNTIYWKKQVVQIVRSTGRPVKNVGPYIRLLKVLTERPYEIIPDRELFVHVVGRQKYTGNESYIDRLVSILNLSFKKADPRFESLKVVWHEGILWDDGRLPFLKLMDVPQIQLHDLEIRWNGQKVDLSRSQREVVICLIARRGTPVSSLELYNMSRTEKVSELGKREKDSLKTYLYAIRQKFIAIDPDFDFIRTTKTGDRIWTIPGTARENLQFDLRRLDAD